MQGKKDYQEKRFADFRVSERINKTSISMAEVIKQAEKGYNLFFQL